MRKLTIQPKIDEAGFKAIERLIGEQLSLYFKNFMIYHAGNSVVESIYNGYAKQTWEVAAFEQFTSMFKLTREFKRSGYGKKVPFAFDPGGWHFCLSLDEETHGCVIVYRWTDVDEDQQFLLISNSFEEFIEGLSADSQV